MKLKNIKNGAARVIQNALQVFAVTCIYGYDTRKKQRELRYRLNIIRQKVQQTIIDGDIYQENRYSYPSLYDWPGMKRYGHEKMISEFEYCIVQMSYLKKDLDSLNDRPNRRWRERFTLDLHTIWGLAASHQWAIQMDLDLGIERYPRDYFSYLAASTYASNNSIWGTASVSDSSCHAQSLSGTSLSGSSISLQSLCISTSMDKSSCDKECVAKCDQNSADDLWDGQYKNDLLEFLNAFQMHTLPTYASNDSIWGTSSVSESSCHSQSLSGSSISGSSISSLQSSLSGSFISGSSISSLQSLFASMDDIINSLRALTSMDKSSCDKECVAICDQESADYLCDGQYENDLLEFLNAFQIDC